MLPRAGIGGIAGHTSEAGWHIYGKPLPDNYQATELLFDGLIVGEQSLELPPSKPMLLKSLGETLPVYSAKFVRSASSVSSGVPSSGEISGTFGKLIEPGPYKIEGTLRFQACSDDVCETPLAIKFELPLTVEAGIPPAPKKKA